MIPKNEHFLFNLKSKCYINYLKLLSFLGNILSVLQQRAYLLEGKNPRNSHPVRMGMMICYMPLSLTTIKETTKQAHKLLNK